MKRIDYTDDGKTNNRCVDGLESGTKVLYLFAHLKFVFIDSYANSDSDLNDNGSDERRKDVNSPNAKNESKIKR
jgi:hypothetical protein